MLLGTGMVLLGALWLLHAIGLLPPPWVFWPMLLVLLGIRGWRNTQRGSRVVSVTVAGLGVILQATLLLNLSGESYLLLLPVTIVLRVLGFAGKVLLAVLPVLLLVGGIVLLRRRRREADAAAPAPEGSSVLDQLLVFASDERKLGSTSFAGGWVAPVFASIEYDLSTAQLATETVTLEVYPVFGSIEIKVPPGWVVESRCVPIFGSVEIRANAPPAGPPDGRLLLSGLVLFASVEID